MVELLHGSLRGDIPSVEPCEVVHLECVGDGVSSVLGCVSVLLQRRGELFPKVGVKGAEVLDHSRGLGGGSVVEVDVERGVIAFVGEEGGGARSGVRGVVVGELGEGKEVDPVVLLVVDVDSEVLLEHLVDAFGLAVGLGVVGGGEVGFDAKEVAEGSPELGGE